MKFKVACRWTQGIARQRVLRRTPSARGYPEFRVPVTTRTGERAIGDSNVAGRYVSSSENYTAKLERALRAKGYDVRVANEGINGDTTAGVLSQIDSAIPKSTRLAIVWVRINDLRAGVSPAKVEFGRQEIAHRLRARGDQGLAAWTATRACFSTAASDRG